MKKQPNQTIQIASISQEEAQETSIHQQALDAFRAMNVEEQRQTMIDAGILTPDGKLAKEYRRTAVDV